jgi:hypothetical protein
LRWEAGLAGMEALSNTPDDQLVQAVEEWASRVTNLVQAQPGLHAWCVERSIVSIRLEKSSNGSWLDMNELKDVYRYMSLDVSGAVPRSATAEERAALAVCCNLGQPVDVADSHAILRIALGSESLAKYIVDPGGNPEGGPDSRAKTRSCCEVFAIPPEQQPLRVIQRDKLNFKDKEYHRGLCKFLGYQETSS